MVSAKLRHWGMSQNRRTLWATAPLLVALVLGLWFFLGAGPPSTDGPIQNPFGLSSACVEIDSPTPFLVAPGEVILGTGEQLSEYRVVMASSTPDEDTTPDVFLVDPEQIGPGATSAPDNDRYESIEFLPLPNEQEPLEGPASWTLVLRLSNTSEPADLFLEGVEYTIDGTRYSTDDTFELITGNC